MNILDLISSIPKFLQLYMCVWNFCSFMYENFTSFIEWASTKFLFHVLLELWIVNFFWFGVYWICTYMCLRVWTCSYELNDKIIIEKVVYMCVNVFYVYFTVGENASVWWPLRWFASLCRTLVFADKITRSWRYF